MLTDQELRAAVGADAYGRSGEKIGKINRIYLDHETGRPAFATVATGLFGLKENFVPLAEAHLEGDRVVVPYEKDQVKDSPKFDDAAHPDDELTGAQEDELYDFYGLPYGSPAPWPQTGSTAATGTSTPPATDDAMTRSEERLVAGVRYEETGRARLRKYIVTEQQQITVPVSHEEVRVEREPITAANQGQAMAGPELSEAEHEVTLHAERPVVGKETVPVERVRLETETVTESETYVAPVRKERIEVEGVEE